MSDVKFVRHSILDILVPEATDLDIEEALQTAAESQDGQNSLIGSISQRNLLYFDENIPIYVILKTPLEEPLTLKAHISRLAVALEAHAISSPAAANPGGESGNAPSPGQARDVVWSSRLDVSEDPIIVVEGTEEDDERDALLIWRMSAFLSRPRVRLQAPAVIFKVSASLQPAPLGNAKIVEDFLPSRVPFPKNVLEPLGADPSLGGRQFYLPASRLAKATPSAQPAPSEVLPLRVMSRRAFRAIPAISSRMRYHRSNDAANRSTILASLELDVPAFAPHAVEMTSVTLKFSTGEVQEMIGGQTLDLPVVCNARDSIACLYSLQQPDAQNHAIGVNSTLRSLDVVVDANVRISESCRPRIQIRWKQNIDFATALNQKFNRVRGSIHRDNRPRSLSTNTNTSGPAGEQSRNFSAEDVGLSATITGQEDVYVGEVFTWGVFIINRSNKPRQFVLTLIPRRRPGENKRASSRPNSSQSLPGSRGGILADAVIDDNVLYAIIKSQGHDNTPLVCLSSDIRTGLLTPGSCFDAEIELIPLNKGPLHVDSLRVLDVDSNEVVNIRDLPDIVAKER